MNISRLPARPGKPASVVTNNCETGHTQYATGRGFLLTPARLASDGGLAQRRSDPNWTSDAWKAVTP